MEPAKSIIDKIGGHSVVAEWLGVSVTQVYRFTYSKKKGGTGGLIPARHQQILLDKAAIADIDLVPADFFSAPPQPGKAAA